MGWRISIEMGVGEAMGVSPPTIGESVSGGGSRLAQITVGPGGFGLGSIFRRVSSLFFRRAEGNRECGSEKIYQSL